MENHRKLAVSIFSKRHRSQKRFVRFSSDFPQVLNWYETTQSMIFVDFSRRIFEKMESKKPPNSMTFPLFAPWDSWKSRFSDRWIWKNRSEIFLKISQSAYQTSISISYNFECYLTNRFSEKALCKLWNHTLYFWLCIQSRRPYSTMRVSQKLYELAKFDLSKSAHQIRFKI